MSDDELDPTTNNEEQTTAPIPLPSISDETAQNVPPVSGDTAEHAAIPVAPVWPGAQSAPGAGEPAAPYGQQPPYSQQLASTPWAAGPAGGEQPVYPPSNPYGQGAWAGGMGAAAGVGGTGPGWVPPGPGWGSPGFGGGMHPPAPVSKTLGHRSRGVLAGVIAALVLLAAGVGIGHYAWQPASTSAITPTSSSSPGSPFGSSGSSGSSGATGGSGPSDVSSIASQVDPGLVDINTTLSYQNEQAAGTGMVLTSTGEVLTNNHVIDGETSISVTDVGNGKTYSASVVGYDRTQDVAVIQLHDASGLHTVSLGDSSSTAVGQNVVAIGNAGGTGGTPSAAGGTVTALKQSITASDEGDGTSETLSGLTETNANIQAGDSGGPLVNTSGQVLGMDTAASAGFSYTSPNGSSNTQGFAIPIDQATSIAQEIEASDSSSTVHIGSTAFLGVEVATSCQEGLGGFGNEGGSGGTTSGAEVCDVVSGSPAQQAGLAEGDVITSVNGQAVSSPTALTPLIASHKPGDTVTIGWTDTSGQAQTGSAQLTSGPPQ